MKRENISMAHDLEQKLCAVEKEISVLNDLEPVSITFNAEQRHESKTYRAEHHGDIVTAALNAAREELGKKEAELLKAIEEID